MTEQEQTEFEAYLRACTDAQVYGVLQKERNAQRNEFAALARTELKRRGLEL